MLKASIVKENNAPIELTALNEIAIAKASFARIIHLRVFINDEFVNCYPADGILSIEPYRVHCLFSFSRWTYNQSQYEMSSSYSYMSTRIECPANSNPSK